MAACLPYINFPLYLAATLLLCLLTVHQALVWRPVSELSKVEIFCATALFMRRCVVLYGVFFCLGIHDSFNRFCNLSCCVYLEKSCNKAIATILVDISCYALALVWSCTISINVLKDAVYKGFCVIVAVAAGVWDLIWKIFFLSLSAAFYTKPSYRLPLRDRCLLLCVL